MKMKNVLFFGNGAIFCGTGADWPGRLSKVVRRRASVFMFRFSRVTRTIKATSPKANTEKTNNKACQKNGMARSALKAATLVILRDVL